MLVKSSPPFFISASWQVTQYLLMKPEVAESIGWARRALVDCPIREEVPSRSRAGRQELTQIPRRTLPKRHWQTGICLFTVATNIVVKWLSDNQKTCCLFARPPAAVDDECSAGDESRFVAGQIKSGGGDFFGPGHSAICLGGGHFLIRLFRVRIFLEPRRDERRFHAAGTDAI